MKHQGLKPGAAFVFGGKKASTVNEKPAETPKRKLEAKPFVSTAVKKQPTHMELADEVESIVDDAYTNLTETTDTAGIDAIIATVLSSLKNMYYKIVNKDNQYTTADELFNIELVSQSFMAISHVVKIVMYRRSLANRYNVMLRTNCKFAFSAVNLENSAEELSFMTVIDYIIDKFVEDTSN